MQEEAPVVSWAAATLVGATAMKLISPMRAAPQGSSWSGDSRMRDSKTMGTPRDVGMRSVLRPGGEYLPLQVMQYFVVPYPIA